MKLVEDLNKYGNDPSNALSIVSFHYPYLDFHKDNITQYSYNSVALGLEPEWEWTYNCPTSEPHCWMRWTSLFGTQSDNYEKAKKWIYTLSPIQFSAVTVLGRTLQSVNIPFIVINFIKKDEVKDYVKEIWDIEKGSFEYQNLREFSKVFENFVFYYYLEDERT